MLFGERDMEALQGFFDGSAHATMLVRAGGFSAGEEEALAQRFLGEQTANMLGLVAEDGKRGVGVEQVRALAASLSTASRAGDRRLVVVSSRFVFGAQTQNILLKIVEEPPEGVFFLILAGSMDSFLPTIVSRSQIIKLHGANEEETVDYLVKELGFKLDEAKMMYLQAGGSSAEVLRLADDEVARKKSLEQLGEAKKFLAQKSYDRLVTLKTYQNPGKRDEATEFLKSLLVVLELASKKDAKETLRWSGLVERTERALVNINLNANSKVELLNLV